MTLKEEKGLWKKGFKRVACLDEAGRGCERPDAQVLTDNGWKFYHEINLKDKVLSYTNDSYIKWQKIEKVIEKDFEGNLIELKNGGIEIVVTPDHYFTVVRRVSERDKKDNNRLKLVGYKAREERKIVTDLSSNDFIPRGGTWKGINKKTFKLPKIDRNEEKLIDIKLWVAFLGIYLAEGSVSYDKKRGSYRIIISQNENAPQNRYKKIYCLLKKLPFRFNKFKTGFSCYNKQLHTYLKQFGNCYSKFIPKDIKELSSQLLNIFINWMILGDGGCYTGKNRKKVCIYYTVSERLKDDFEEILLKAGWTYHTRVRTPRDGYIEKRVIKKENQVPCFEIRLRRNNKAQVKSLHKKEIFYHGKVFCLQLPKYHNFYVRRNGTGYFTGNSLAGPVVAGAVMIKNSKLEARNSKQISILQKPNSKQFEKLEFRIWDLSRWRSHRGSSIKSGFRISNLGFRILLKEVRDSKKLTPKKREKLYKAIVNWPFIEWGIGKASQKVIDKINILEATKVAMIKAIKNLNSKFEIRNSKQALNSKWGPAEGLEGGGRVGVRIPKIDFLIVDGNFKLDLPIPQRSIVKADEKVFSCAAASIIAKVTRDRIMEKYSKKYPRYGFERHKGYPTKHHRRMIKKYGPCRIHRKSFRLLRITNHLPARQLPTRVSFSR